MALSQSSGMIAAGGFSLPAVNFHNQGLPRAQYQGPRGSGFTVEFLAENARIRLDEALEAGAVAVQETALEAVVESTEYLKQKMRSFIDAHFGGSVVTRNLHRRSANAAVQSVYYNDIATKGQFTGLIYSKLGYRQGGDFVDFLLLHIHGGTVKPANGDWLRIPNPEVAGSRFAQTGTYAAAGSRVFFVPSKDGQKLFLLRRYGTSSPGALSGQSQLLATLVKSLNIEPTLAGLEPIFAERGAVLEQRFDAIFSRKKAEGRFV